MGRVVKAGEEAKDPSGGLRLVDLFDHAIPLVFASAVVFALGLGWAGLFDLALIAATAALWTLSFATCVALHRRFLADRGLLPPIRWYSPSLGGPVVYLLLHLTLIALAFGSVVIAIGSGSIVFLAGSTLGLSCVLLAGITLGRYVLARPPSRGVVPVSRTEVMWAALVVALPLGLLPTASQMFVGPPMVPALPLLTWPLVLAWLFAVQFVDVRQPSPRMRRRPRHR